MPALARFTLTTRSDAPETWVGQFPEIQAMPDDCTTASVADVKRPLTRKRLGRALAELQAAADKGDTVSMVTLTRHVLADVENAPVSATSGRGAITSDTIKDLRATTREFILASRHNGQMTTESVSRFLQQTKELIEE